MAFQCLTFLLILIGNFIANVQALKTCVHKQYQGPDNPMNCVCNATYCDEFPPLGTLKPNQAAVYTSSQSGKRFYRQTLNFDVSRTPLPIKITANDSQKFQSIIGFGGAFTDAAGINLARLSPAAQQNLIHAYFGPGGIGYTVGRTPMASCDFSTHPYSYDDVVGDLNLTNFALTEEDYNYKIPFIKMAKNLLGYKLKLFASPWSAPGWMKTTGLMKGGGLLKGAFGGPYYQTWANYFLRYFEEYAKNNITYWGVTMENEPSEGDDLNYGFQAMYFDSAMERDYTKGLWGQTLRSNPITKHLKLMICDDFRGNVVDYANTVLYDKDAYNYVDGIAVHWYGDNPNNAYLLTQVHNNFPQKYMLYTEACVVASPSFGNWLNGDRYAHSIIEVLQHWVGGWTDWNICLDPQGGPNWVNNFVDSPIIVSNTSDEFEKQPMYYALGHFAKFIVPDSTVIGLKMDNITSQINLEGVAALTPSGEKVIVLNNRDASSTYQVSIVNKQGALLNLSLEPRSFTTIVYRLVDDFRIYRGALSQAEVASLAQTLSVYYKFDESAGSTSTVDSSGGNNNGSLIQWSSGNLTSNGTFASGLVGNALSLDGNGSYLSIPNSGQSRRCDVSAWVFSITGRYLIFTPADNNGFARYAIVLDGATQAIYGAEAVPTGQWVHVAVTVSGNNGTYYINGRVDATASVYLEPFQLASGASTAGLTEQNFIGKSHFSADPYLNGAVDEFRVYGGALSARQVAALAQTLTAQLSFSESSGTVTADQTGNGNIGQLSGGASFVAGRNGNAVKLDGSSGYVSLPSGIVSGFSDMTIATWVYINTQVTWGRVFDFGTGTNTWMFLTPKNSDNGNVRFSIILNGNTGRQNIDGNSALPTGVWVHVAVTLRGNVGTLYVNGSVSATATITIDLSQLGTTTNNYIGKSQFSSDPYLNALMDGFRVYYRALSIDQIAALSQRLSVNLKFDESSGSTVADSSGNGNSGTLVGNATFTTGVSGNALTLDGNNSFVNLTNSATLLANLSDFTISSWVYLHSEQQWARLFDFGFNTSRYMMFTPADNGNSPKFTTYNGNDNAVWANRGTVDLPVGKWTHVAITLQGNVLTIYFNATLTGQDVIYVAPNQIYGTDIPAGNYIGRSQYSSDPYLNATVDDFRLYNGAFSAVQVAVLYNKQI